MEKGESQDQGQQRTGTCNSICQEEEPANQVQDEQKLMIFFSLVGNSCLEKYTHIYILLES